MANRAQQAEQFVPDEELVDLGSNGAVEDDDDTVLNLTDVDENANPNLVPTGTYDGRTTNVTYGPSAKGNKMYTWEGEIPHPEKTGKTVRLWYWTTFTPDDLPRTKKTMLRVNPEVEALFSRFKPSEAIPYLINRPCRFKVKQRMYEGQMRNNVTEILAPTQEGLGFLSEPQ